MATFELPRRPEHGVFSAVIGTDTDYEIGQIRIEPPFNPSESLMILGGFDRNVDFDFFASNKDSVLIEYSLPSSTGSAEENLEILSENLNNMLEILGQTASKELFLQYWQKY